jgi:hypothetical protein
MDKWEDIICPVMREKLEKNKLHHRFWQSTFNGDGKFEVRHGMDGYIVDMKAKTCTCRMWQLSGIPCSHSITAIYFNKDEPERYVSKWLMTGTNKRIYKHSLQPLNGERMWPRTDLKPMLPPPDRRMPGRPKTTRRKDIHEETKTRSEVTRVGRTMKCSECNSIGHNKSGCKVLLHTNIINLL